MPAISFDLCYPNLFPSVCSRITSIRNFVFHTLNDGPEVFVVLDGEVDMHIRKDGVEDVLRLRAGDIFHADNGDEHVAHPDGPVRALVIEKAGSV
jgi:mannose-6-phosphate isomerase-like protein (cupin superfamily)